VPRSTAVASYNIGTAHSLSGDTERALDALSEALARFEAIAAATAAPDSLKRRRDAAMALLSLGLTLNEAGRHAEALQRLERARGLLEELAVADASDSQVQRDAALCRAEIGVALGGLRRFEAGLGELAGALAALEELARRDPESHRARLFVVQPQVQIGELLLARGEPAEAARRFAQALEIARPLVADADNAEARFLVARAQEGLAAAHAVLAERGGSAAERRRHWRQARDAYADAGETWVDLEDRGALAGWKATKPDDMSERLAACDRVLADIGAGA
jgi:tetratricopeptide (TPR) repeat protein